MLHSVNSLYNHRVSASDGLAGGIVDFYFNDRDWSISHIVASTHPARLHKSTLLPPEHVRQIDSRENLCHVRLTRAQCEQLAPASSVVPVCRQYMVRAASPGRADAALDPHLRCTTAIAGNEINNGEQHLGIVHDFLIDPKSWRIAFLVGRRFGAQAREFLVPTSAVSQISFASRRVAIQKFHHWDLVFEKRNGYNRALEAVAA